MSGITASTLPDEINFVTAVLRILVGLHCCPVETSIFKAVFLWEKLND
jgi:hypothetical protein